MRYLAVAGIACSWLTLPPLAILLGVWMELGAFGAWIGLAIGIGLGALLFWVRVLRGGYREAAEQSAARQRSLLTAALGGAE